MAVRHCAQKARYAAGAGLAACLLAAVLAGSAAADDGLSAARQDELGTLLYQDCGSCHGMTLRGGLGPALAPARMQASSEDSQEGFEGRPWRLRACRPTAKRRWPR